MTLKTKLKVADLTGSVLNAAVIMALGYKRIPGQLWFQEPNTYDRLHPWQFDPANSRDQAMALIEAKWIGLERPSAGQTPPQWRALMTAPPGSGVHLYSVVEAWGTTPMLAVCRCIVASVYGEFIEIETDMLS